MLRLLGDVSLHLTFVTALAAAMSGVVALRTGSRRYHDLAVAGVYVSFGLIATVCSIMLYALATHDFEIVAVARYSDTRMSWMYLMAALWGGQAGSLTFWSGMLGVFSAASLYIHRERDRPLVPGFAVVTMMLLASLVFILLFASNPFEIHHIEDAPAEGSGLNPLLQTTLMVMHPPSLLIGYVSMAIPFAWCMSALLANRLDNAWLVPARRWALVSWLFLSIGNMLGGMWAYEELGWGGYWAWDPVENAAFMPWLGASAFLHSLMVQERRGMLKRWNVVLITLSFLLTLLGTFITRSGLIDSVHTFAQSSIGTYFFVLLVAAVTLCTVMLALRWKGLKSEAAMDSPLSREAVFLMNNWILVGMVFVVLWGTLYPKLYEMASGDKISIGPPWFNKYMVPLGVILVLLMGIGTLIAWKKSSLKNFRRNFTGPLIATALLAPLAMAGYWYGRAVDLESDVLLRDGLYSAVGFTGALFVISSSVSEYVRGVLARRKAHSESLAESVLNLLSKQRRRYGGYIVHVGFVMAVIGWCGASFKLEQDVSMREGESVTLGDYEVRFDGLSEEESNDRYLILAHLTVLKDGQEVAQLRPGRAIFHSSPENPTSEIDIRTNPKEDLYFALTGFGENGQLASFKMLVSPLVWWFWFGGGVIVFGTLICLWPEPERITQTVYRRAAVSAAATLLLALLSASPLLLLSSIGHAQEGSAPASVATLDPGHDHGPSRPDNTKQVHSAELREIMAVIRVHCPASGNPTMANSSPTCADFQQDLATVNRLLAEGKTKDEIFDHFVQLRGPDVLAVPRQEGRNWIVFILPIAALLAAAALLAYKVRQWSHKSAAEPPGLTAAASPEAHPDESEDAYMRRLQQELTELR